jgi:hypothetical protein
LLAGKIIAMVDISKSPTISSLWSYAGQAPNSKKIKGEKANWNQELKMVCYQISDSFVKKRTPKYREIYDAEKKKQLALLESAKTMKKSIITLQTNDLEVEEEPGVECKPSTTCSPPTSKMHCERRARRKAVKEFLKDYWLETNKNTSTPSQSKRGQNGNKRV